MKPIVLDSKSIARFERKIVRGGLSCCWSFISTKNNKGYSMFQLGGAAGSKFLAHRISYTIYNGEISKGAVVMHTCDNPCCVNPKHLILGTQRDNMLDKERKGRANHHKKLTRALTQTIQQMYKAKMTQAEIAHSVGLSLTAVMRAIHGGKKPGAPKVYRGSENSGAKITEELALEIKRRAATGEKQGQIAAALNVSVHTVKDVRSGRRWAHVVLD